MKIISVLVILGIAIVNTSNASDDTEVMTSENHDVALTSSSEESPRIRPVFPKSAQKFLMTTKSTRIRNVTIPISRSSRKPVFKIVSKAMKIKNKNYWKTATTRPSLMRYTKFTVHPLTALNKHRHSIKQTNKGGEIRRKYNNRFRKITNDPNKDDSSEEISENSPTNDKRKDNIRHVKAIVQRFHNLGSKIRKEKLEDSKSKENVNKLITTTDKIKLNETEISSEEREDRKEFIFVTPKIIKEHATRVTEDSDESAETTSNILEKELKLRRKRSINVIEEENLGTTVSGFKFTGKIASLSSDLTFRNINT